MAQLVNSALAEAVQAWALTSCQHILKATGAIRPFSLSAE